MEIKAFLEKPYTEEQRINFIVENNHKQGYEIRETEEQLQAWGLTEQEIADKERQAKDLMTLTPADVERALYKEKQMNFDDLKTLIQTTMTGIDMKALNIEFNATYFYRGAKFGNNKLFDFVGLLLGYPQEQVEWIMDFLFENKVLPTENEIVEQFPEPDEVQNSD